MEHYEKGKVVEVEDEDGPFVSLGARFGEVTTMRVRQGSKLRNLLTFAMKKMKEDETRRIIFTGIGQATGKTVTCVEIMKKEIKNLHQINKAYYRKTEEYWEPKEEGLDRLRVNREVPALAVLLSKDPLDTNELGYQAPGSFEVGRIAEAKQEKKRKNSQPAKSDHRKKGQYSNKNQTENISGEGEMGVRKKQNRRKNEKQKKDEQNKGFHGKKNGEGNERKDNRSKEWKEKRAQSQDGEIKGKGDRTKSEESRLKKKEERTENEDGKDKEGGMSKGKVSPKEDEDRGRTDVEMKDSNADGKSEGSGKHVDKEEKMDVD